MKYCSQRVIDHSRQCSIHNFLNDKQKFKLINQNKPPQKTYL